MKSGDEEARRRAAELRERGALAGLDPPWGVAGAVPVGEHVSRRRFYRLVPDDPAPGRPETLVLVVYEPGDRGILERHVRATRWLEEAGVPVPALHGVGSRALLVEDGGDRLLADVDRPGERGEAYGAAVDVIHRVQGHGREASPPNPGDALDRGRLLDELEFFELHTVRNWLGVDEDTVRRREGYAELAQAVSRLPVAMCHRDLHARNLLVRDRGRLLVLDFQDLMEGPFLYDLASLLWDNYCDVPEEIRVAALERFWNDCGVSEERLAGLPSTGPVPDLPAGLPGAARRAFCQVAAQRHLKALGTFGYQVTRGGRPGYARFVPRTWRHARRALEALGMHDLLAGLAALQRLPPSPPPPACL